MIDFKRKKIEVAEWIYLNKINYLKYMLGSKENLKCDKTKNKIFITLLPSHGNLGDHAIAYASNKFLEENFPEHQVIQLDMFEIYKYGKAIRKVLSKGDFIVIIGGGNMNNLYMHEEWTRRFVIKTFKNVPIISLPQTITFTNDNKGKIELNKTKKIYNNNNNLTIFARENKSYEIMKKTFKSNKVLENPDMVFYLEDLDLNKDFNRDGILVCLRNDKEAYIKSEDKESIINKLKSDYNKVKISDTVINKRVSVKTREEELFKLWSDFFSSEVVITDRLHGMIFAVITKTPCIVIRNNDHKIIGSYEWINDLNYIKLVENVSYMNIKKNIETLKDIKKLSKTNFKKKYFNKLKESML
ncbi:polysaccharide pyruvyl transferase family protein [Clostridium perfringens]|uniref:polysaccharide pyruvyl transferase family protein n=1 Tax=Clostridium perfringens TaxID=1502 RepID=UPI0018E4B02A|nr:polysaccharide pyruvyl transferase family protein [Clostridium perfringens]MBI6063036.1 polysaccharide pyruvyl transferase family protein [Clostridium perfringens]